MIEPVLYVKWQIEPVLIGGIFTLLVVYFLSVGPLRSRMAPKGTPFPVKQASWFAFTMLFLFLNEGSPLHDLAERYLLSAHMVQHFLLVYVVAPLMIWSTPKWFLSAFLENKVMYPVMKYLLHPATTFLAFALVMNIYHVPNVYNLALSNTSLHHSIHFIMLFTALMFWWPIMSPLKKLGRPSYMIQLAYLFLTPIAQLPMFAAVTFSDYVLYPVYENMPVRLFGMTPLQDQAFGGVIMNISGQIAGLGPFVYIWFKYYREANQGEKPAENVARDVV